MNIGKVVRQANEFVHWCVKVNFIELEHYFTLKQKPDIMSIWYVHRYTCDAYI